MKLTSLDYASLLNWIAYTKYGVLLNKTQINKLLFMCYGMYLAATGGQILFDDDTPKAWPFGPVFPRVYKKFIPGRAPVPFSMEMQEEFSKNEIAMQLAEKIIDKYHNYSAYALSQWSHKEGGPWHITIYGKDGKKVIRWNQQIDKDVIQNYFTPKNNG